MINFETNQDSCHSNDIKNAEQGTQLVCHRLISAVDLCHDTSYYCDLNTKYHEVAKVLMYSFEK